MQCSCKTPRVSTSPDPRILQHSEFSRPHRTIGLWVPLIAALGFGLSVAATFGLTVAIWQEGWLGIISDPQPVISFLPIILIGLVFGLAMDYQVFLVSRMRESYSHGESASDAVVHGYK